MANECKRSRTLTYFSLRDRIGEFLELSNEETIHIMGVGVETPSGTQGGMKAPFSKAGKAFLAKVQACGHQPHIPLLQGIIHHPLILFHLDQRANAASRRQEGELKL